MATPELQSLDPETTQRLPYHFAKRHGVISARQGQDAMEVWVRPGVSSAALAELRRVLGQPIQICELSPADFESALNRAYERGMNHAMQIVGDLGDDMDLAELTQNLP